MPVKMKSLPQNGRKVKATIEEESVCILGLGYVGLTLGMALAEVGVKITGIDRNKELIGILNSGKSHFYERGLDALIKKCSGETFEAKESLSTSDQYNVFVVSVGTPVDKNGEPNLSFVEESATTIAKHLKPENLVILRSTVPVGTTRKVVLPILEKVSGLKAGRDFSLVFAPERTVEGNALKELRELPQIVGAIDEKSFIKASSLFRRTTPTIINVSSLEAAEMIKIMDNTYRDLNFAIANELALISGKLGLNAVECIKAANMGYNRTNIPVPSPGVGGACLTKDPYILLDVAKKVGHESRFIATGRNINEYMPVHVAHRVKEFLVEEKKNKNAKIFIMGFAFKGKPLTSDTRHSPTTILVDKLKEVSNNIFGFDPAVEPKDIKKDFGIQACSIEEGFKDADVVIVMLNQDAYTDLDIFSLLAKTKKPALFYDAWQMFKSRDVNQIKGVLHEGIGFAE